MSDSRSKSAESKGHGMLCPACKLDLVMSERQGSEIDYCPKCRGVWLDRGELDKIIERSDQASAPSQQASRGYPRHGEDDEHALGRSRHSRDRGGFL